MRTCCFKHFLHHVYYTIPSLYKTISNGFRAIRQAKSYFTLPILHLTLRIHNSFFPLLLAQTLMKSTCTLSEKEIQAGVSLISMRENINIQTQAMSQNPFSQNIPVSPHGTVQSKSILQRKAQLSSLAKGIVLEDLRPHFGKPIVQVAREFGICTTFLKRICRRCGIKRWPHRQIRSLMRTIDMLSRAREHTNTFHDTVRVSQQIERLESKLQHVIEDPDANSKLDRVKKSILGKNSERNLPLGMDHAEAASLVLSVSNVIQHTQKSPCTPHSMPHECKEISHASPSHEYITSQISPTNRKLMQVSSFLTDPRKDPKNMLCFCDVSKS